MDAAALTHRVRDAVARRYPDLIPFLLSDDALNALYIRLRMGSQVFNGDPKADLRHLMQQAQLGEALAAIHRSDFGDLKDMPIMKGN